MGYILDITHGIYNNYYARYTPVNSLKYGFTKFSNDGNMYTYVLIWYFIVFNKCTALLQQYQCKYGSFLAKSGF